MSSIAQEALEQLKMSLSGVKSGKTEKNHETMGSRQYPGSYREISSLDEIYRLVRSNLISGMTIRAKNHSKVPVLYTFRPENL